MSQRFDLLALRVLDAADARAVAEALHDAPVPLNSILTGSEAALALIGPYYQKGTLRYSPGNLPPDELGWLVEASLSSSLSDLSAEVEGAGAVSGLQEIDLEELIERAASRVYDKAKRKRQRFNTVVEGPTTGVFGDAAKLERTLGVLLDMVVSFAPRGALVSVEARARHDDWLLRIGASAGSSRTGGLAHLAEALRTETQVLRAAYRDVSAQGGLLWLELSGRAAVGVCIALPLAPERGENNSV